MEKTTISPIFKCVSKSISVLAVLFLLTLSAAAQYPCNAHFTSNPDSLHVNTIDFHSPANAYGTKYYWSFGDGSPDANDSNPTHQYANGGAYYVCLYIADSLYACTDHWCDSVHVGGPLKPLCNAQFEHYSSNTNADSVHFYQYNTGPGYTFAWSFGDGSSSDSPSPWHLYRDTGNMIVCLTLTDSTPGGKCTATQCDTIHIPGCNTPPPLCNATFQDYPNTHNPDSIHFYASTPGSNTTKYIWRFGDGSYSTDPSPWHLFANNGHYYVCLAVSDSNCAGKCTDTECDSVFVGQNNPCNSKFNFLCDSSGLNVKFTSNPNPVGTKYYWIFGDGSPSSPDPNPTHPYAHGGTYYVCLYVNDSAVCTSESCDSVRVPGPNICVANAQFVNYPSNTNADSVHFYPTGGNPPNTKYYWSFGDGNYSGDFNPWHIYAPGNYVACLTVIDSTNGGSCAATWCDSVHVAGPVRPVCNSHFQFYVAGTNPDSLHFYTAGGSPTTKYSWTFGDGGTSDNATPWHYYSTPGIYYVCLSVSDSTSGGKCAESWCDSVKVVGPHVPLCNANFYHYALNSNPDSIHFYTNNTSATIKYSWSFGDGGTSHNADPWHLYAPGNYQACLTITDSTLGGTCTATWCDSIHIVAPHAPICDAHFNYYFAHNPDSIHFYPATTGSATRKYSWSFGDGTSSSEPYPWHFYTDTGTYTVCLTVTDSTNGGKCTDTECDTIHIAPPPPPICNAHFTHYAANSYNTIFRFVAATNPPGAKYSWDFGDGNTGSGNELTHTYTTNGTYYVCLTVTDSTNYGSCSSMWCDSVHVGIPRIPCNASFQYQFAFYVNTVYFIHGPNAPDATYLWNFGDGSTSGDPNALHQFANPGTYWVCLTVNDSIGGCTATTCDSVTVGANIAPICNSNFYFKPGNVAHSLYFFSSPNPPSTKYLWEFGDGTSSTQAIVFHQYPGAGSYRVCLTVSDSVSGCSDTRCLTIGPLRFANGGSTLDASGSDAIATIYPNPVTEYAVLHIENTNGAVTFRMFDNLGRLVNGMSNLSNGDYDLSRQGLRSGLYLYEVIDGDNNVTRGKIVVQ